MEREELQIEAEKAHIRYGYKSTICASVGSGKSKIAINRIKNHYMIKKSPKIIFSGARNIYLSTFKQELIKWGLEDKIEEITFCCVASLKNYNTIDWDLIIIDESHLDVERILAFLHIYKRKDCEILLLTGTPLREGNFIGKEIYKICPISFRKDIDTSIHNKLINDYHITIIMHELSNEQYMKYSRGLQSEKQKYGWLYKCYLDGMGKMRKKFPFELVNLKVFFKNLHSKKEIAEKLLKHIDAKVLIYAGSIDQANSMGIHCYHSNLHKDERDSNLKMFMSGDIHRLFNVAGIRESVNIHNLKYGIIMAPDASQNAFEQTVGRFSRLVIGEIAQIFVLCAKGTIEELWINKAIKQLDSTKISKINIEQIEDIYK